MLDDRLESPIARSQFFGEFAFVNAQMGIPGAGGFVAARTLEVASSTLSVGHYHQDRFTLKIPATIPPGPYTLAVRLNQATTRISGSYLGRPVRTLQPLVATGLWQGKRAYKPVAYILLK